ncbi:MAG: DUF4349 domain-containing protein [Spirochaetia bacterium]|jgi:hypothetical protein|nr:DUF4349 domain-containing protein [Spirochaetia bacterium]
MAKTRIALIACAAALLAWGCSGQYEGAAQAEAGNGLSRGSAGAADSASPAEAETGQMAGDPRIVRKLVKHAQIRLRVADLEEADRPVQAALRACNGYAARTAGTENHRSYTLRVPSSSYEAFLSALPPLGTVLYREESTEDVTLNYYDIEGRLATKKTLLSTYRNYLAKAKNIEEILSVESKIADVQNEIDSLGTRLKTLSDLTDYATVELEMYLPAYAGPSREPGLGERIMDLFASVGDFFSAALLVIVSVLVFGIPLLAFAAFAYWLLLGKVGLLRSLWRLIAKKGKF